MADGVRDAQALRHLVGIEVGIEHRFVAHLGARAHGKRPAGKLPQIARDAQRQLIEIGGRHFVQGRSKGLERLLAVRRGIEEVVGTVCDVGNELVVVEEPGVGGIEPAVRRHDRRVVIPAPLRALQARDHTHDVVVLDAEALDAPERVVDQRIGAAARTG